MIEEFIFFMMGILFGVFIKTVVEDDIINE